jgi:hypothetical protein
VAGELTIHVCIGGTDVIQLRAVAAQAYSSVLSPEDALQLAVTTSESSDDLNSRHGHMLVRRHLIADVIEWSEIDQAKQERIEINLINQLKASSRCATIETGAIGCVQEYINITQPSSSFLSSITQYLDPRTAPAKQPQPGGDLLAAARSQLRLTMDGRDELLLLLLGDDASEDEKLTCLEHLTQRGDQVISETVTKRILELGLASSSGSAVQIAALSFVSEQTSHTSHIEMAVDMVRKLSEIVVNSKCVPLREVALETLGWALSNVSSDIQDSIACLIAD